jgi:hypothetical protein
MQPRPNASRLYDTIGPSFQRPRERRSPQNVLVDLSSRRSLPLASVLKEPMMRQLTCG